MSLFLYFSGIPVNYLLAKRVTNKILLLCIIIITKNSKGSRCVKTNQSIQETVISTKNSQSLLTLSFLTRGKLLTPSCESESYFSRKISTLALKAQNLLMHSTRTLNERPFSLEPLLVAAWKTDVQKNNGYFNVKVATLPWGALYTTQTWLNDITAWIAFERATPNRTVKSKRETHRLLFFSFSKSGIISRWTLQILKLTTMKSIVTKTASQYAFKNIK